MLVYPSTVAIFTMAMTHGIRIYGLLVYVKLA